VERLESIFQLADSTGNGRIDARELQALHQSLGEPLTDEEARDAFEEMDENRSGDISFDDFLRWYTTAHDRRGFLSRKGESYSRRFKKLMATIDSPFRLSHLSCTEAGEAGTLGYRVHFRYDDGGSVKRVSPWHDIPLHAGGGMLHFVCEIPRGSRRKFEVATGEAFNPIKQDTRHGRLREFQLGDLAFNYGAFPQTWEDPNHLTRVGGDEAFAGDNDPIDGVEVGSRALPTGTVARVKVLGALAMIDDGEMDWKVLCVNAEDPLAEELHSADDLESALPGVVDAVREWFRTYKVPEGKGENRFGFGGELQGAEVALETIEETHRFWKALTLDGHKTV